jgi:hypothetical protein
MKEQDPITCLTPLWSTVFQTGRFCGGFFLFLLIFRITHRWFLRLLWFHLPGVLMPSLQMSENISNNSHLSYVVFWPKSFKLSKEIRSCQTLKMRNFRIHRAELRFYAWYMGLYGEETVCMDHLRRMIRTCGFLLKYLESYMRIFCAVSYITRFRFFLRHTCRKGGLYVREDCEGENVGTHTKRVDGGGVVRSVSVRLVRSITAEADILHFIVWGMTFENHSR